MKTTKFKWSRDAEGEWLSIQVNDAMSFLQTIVEGKTYDVTIKEWHPKRSGQQNRMFHSLCSEIANLTNISAEEVKKQIVFNYGVVDKKEGKIVGCQLPKGVNPDSYYPYCKWYKDTEINGKEYSCYLFYKRTSEMDTKEMSHLIDGLVQECELLGIHTLNVNEY